MRKEAAHIQKSMERRCLFFVWNSTQTCNKEPLLLHKENTLQQTKSRPNPQPTGILRGEFFSQIFSTTWKYFKEIFALLTLLWRSKLSISYFSKHKTWPLLSPQKRRGREVHWGDKSLICFFREVVHPEKQALSCWGRKTLGLSWCWYCSRVSLGWNHPTSGSATMWCLSIWCVSMSWMIPHVESKPEWI